MKRLISSVVLVAFFGSTSVQAQQTFNNPSGTVIQLDTSSPATTACPSASVLCVRGNSSAAARMTIMAFGSNPQFFSMGIGGTKASPSATTSGQVIVNLTGTGWSPAGEVTNARAAVSCTATETWTNSAQGARCGVVTTATGGTTTTEKVGIENDGGITVPAGVTGGSKGAGSVNATTLYQNNVQVATLTGSESLTNKTLTAATLATRLVKGVYVIDASAVANSVTGTTTETTLSTIAVPANSMGANGILRITVQLGYSGGTSTWTPRVKFNGTAYLDPSAFGNTAFSARMQAQIANRNATNSQVGNATTQANWVSATAAVVTSSHDTTSSQNITITCQLASAADTCSMHSYLVELIVP